MSLLDKYIRSVTSDEPLFLKELVRQSHLHLLQPRMLSGHVQGRFLSFMVSVLQPQKVLELGTYSGYSAYCLAENLPDQGLLHTIEINEEIAEFTKHFFAKTDVSRKIKFHVGESLDIIPQLNEFFDLVFIDANKRDYLQYYHCVFPYLNSGALVIADNVLWDGHVVNDDKKMNDPQTKGIIEFNEYIKNDIRVENVLLPLRDGLMMVRKK